MFSPDEIHAQFDELFKTADNLNRGQYTHYESFLKSSNKLDRERDYLLRRAIDLCSFKNVDCNDIEFNDMTLDSIDSLTPFFICSQNLSSASSVFETFLRTLYL
jgi:hypothetical protein